MCGIFLVISKKTIKKKMFQCFKCIKKRGPDAYKFEFFNNDKIFM